MKGEGVVGVKEGCLCLVLSTFLSKNIRHIIIFWKQVSQHSAVD